MKKKYCGQFGVLSFRKSYRHQALSDTWIGDTTGHSVEADTYKILCPSFECYILLLMSFEDARARSELWKLDPPLVDSVCPLMDRRIGTFADLESAQCQ